MRLGVNLIVVMYLACSLPVCVQANLIGYWPLDGNVEDSSGFGNDGILISTATGTEWISDGQVGGALSLRGDGDYVVISPDDPTHFILTVDNLNSISGYGMSISFWCRIDSFGSTTYQFFVSRGDAYGVLQNSNTDRMRFWCTSVTAISSIGGIADGQWHHVACTNDGVYSKIYVDAVLTAEQPTSDLPVEGEWSDIWIGAAETDNERNYAGDIDEVKIFDEALTAAQIVDFYIADGGMACSIKLAGDLNGDCQVDIDDMFEIIQNWLQCNNFSQTNCF